MSQANEDRPGEIPALSGTSESPADPALSTVSMVFFPSGPETAKGMESVSNGLQSSSPSPGHKTLNIEEREPESPAEFRGEPDVASKLLELLSNQSRYLGEAMVKISFRPPPPSPLPNEPSDEASSSKRLSGKVSEKVSTKKPSRKASSKKPSHKASSKKPSHKVTLKKPSHRVPSKKPSRRRVASTKPSPDPTSEKPVDVDGENPQVSNPSSSPLEPPRPPLEREESPSADKVDEVYGAIMEQLRAIGQILSKYYHNTIPAEGVVERYSKNPLEVTIKEFLLYLLDLRPVGKAQSCHRARAGCHEGALPGRRFRL
jgi:hypothetical protein